MSLRSQGVVVGLFRKMTSISTLGLVDYRSDGERQAKYARQTRNAARASALQQAAMLNLQREQLSQAQAHHQDIVAPGWDRSRITQHPQQQQLPAPQAAQLPPPVPVPPGWYLDAQGSTRWWDGTRWTENTR